MRFSLPAAALLSLLLAACATQPPPAPSKYISQSGQLKVHPGLLGQQVPPELQEQATPQAVAVASKPAESVLPGQAPTQAAHFDADSTHVRAADKDTLRAHALYLTRNPSTKLRLEGHADERGSAEYNVRLGQKRAESVRAALVSQGVDEKQTSIRSLGKSQPKLVGHDESAWSQNRRVEFIYETPQQK